MKYMLPVESDFVQRHIGTNETQTAEMLQTLKLTHFDELIEKTIPSSIRLSQPLQLPAPVSEYEYIKELHEIAKKNILFKTFIGQGYYNTITPAVIQRNLFENPGWYTQYTPYQAEIAQGRLESLLIFQTMVADLTALPLANASLLDEATAAAEAMLMLFHYTNKSNDTFHKKKFFVDEHVWKQTKEVLITRATPLNIELQFGNYEEASIDNTFFGAFLQYPNSNGAINDYRNFIQKVHQINGYVVMATDLLALTLLTPPGELDADVAVGAAQRFGVPLGYGGPHAAFFSAKEEFKREIPGRIIGVSVDAQGNTAFRMALQTREQHIKREKATSNICTAQALLANMAAMYAVYHGPKQLQTIATRILFLTQTLEHVLQELGFENENTFYFDTLKIKVKTALIQPLAEENGINFYYFNNNYVGISLDETSTEKDVLDIAYVFAQALGKNAFTVLFKEINYAEIKENIPSFIQRTSTFLTHPVFHKYHTETKMMRYLKYLENKDLALNRSMISLGSCTMKLNAATEMMPLSWPAFSNLHPFVPLAQAAGYQQLMQELAQFLCEITGFDACTFQPNSGAQGEYTGLLTIRAYHYAQNAAHRNIVLIPVSAHGTNPASAVMAGMKVVIVKSEENGYIAIDDLKAKAEQYKENLAALMVTYPSTHGVFEEGIQEICNIIHQCGGLVYLDGANMNAQVGLTSPAAVGADICHLNLHKTFAIPHGGGGPGMGPVCAKAFLKDFLPAPVFLGKNEKQPASSTPATYAVSAAPYGSASILLISYGYIKMLGAEGLTKASQYAILNANYMKARLQPYYQIVYTGKEQTCAHEFILDLRPFKTVGVEVEDVAKRLIDYGFHAPTVSFPVAGTMMIEPTESEDKEELDRFCDAMIEIYKEVKAIEEGTASATDNVLKNAPHTEYVICADEWKHSYTRRQAAFPLPHVVHQKFWPSVARVNNTYGDRNLVCTCPPTEEYAQAEA